jgi:hypothetical protein
MRSTRGSGSSCDKSIGSRTSPSDPAIERPQKVMREPIGGRRKHRLPQTASLFLGATSFAARISEEEAEGRWTWGRRKS